MRNIELALKSQFKFPLVQFVIFKLFGHKLSEVLRPSESRIPRRAGKDNASRLPGPGPGPYSVAVNNREGGGGGRLRVAGRGLNLKRSRSRIGSVSRRGAAGRGSWM